MSLNTMEQNRDLRSALGHFATGVTVLTARAADDSPIGVTISSFNSVSLDPPLILWSLSLNSPNLEAFRNARHYAVNILAAGQNELSDRFASRTPDRFAGLAFRTGLGNIPLIEECCAWFECSSEAHYPGGDHLILIGRVERFSEGKTDSPLVFHKGRYCALTN
jgi:flavin reductase (DIM6/NTAB) family NADH-FMN oxidoreductase RutF